MVIGCLCPERRGFSLEGLGPLAGVLGIESPRPPKKIPSPLRISPVSGEILRIGGFAPVLLDALLSIVVWEHRGMFGVLSGTGNLLGAGVPVSRMAGAGYSVPCLGVVGARSPHKKNPPSEEDGVKKLAGRISRWRAGRQQPQTGPRGGTFRPGCAACTSVPVRGIPCPELPEPFRAAERRLRRRSHGP